MATLINYLEDEYINKLNSLNNQYIINNHKTINP